MESIATYDARCRQHGVWKRWNRSGQLAWEGHFRHGQRHGPWVFYNEDGTVAEKSMYRANQLIAPDESSPDKK